MLAAIRLFTNKPTNLIMKKLKVPYTKFDPKRWLKDLRSGNFKQTDGFLKDVSGGYCCLGVACTQFGEIAKADENYFFPADLDMIQRLSNEAFLNPENNRDLHSLQEVLALLNDGSFDLAFKHLKTLWKYTDEEVEKFREEAATKDWTFNDIADFIETHIEWVFVNESE